ncbi:MAG: universal stress protein [Pseudobdellovibrionaceae bacterium]
MDRKLRMNKIAWAVDPYENRQDLKNKVSQILMCFEKQSSVEVYPIHVLNQPLWSYSPIENEIFEKERLRATEDNLQWIVDSFGFESVKKPVILRQTGASVSSSVDLLCEYLDKENFDLVIVGTHGRSGFKRFVMGSFAETLLLRSALPVLVIGAKNEGLSKMDHVLFPTELDDSSEEIFREVVGFCKDMGSRLTLFHSVMRPEDFGLEYNVGYLSQEPAGGALSLSQMFETELQRKRDKAQAWVDWGRYRQVDTNFILESSSKSIDECICRSADEKKADLIVMESHTGPLEAALIGSTTRKVVRQSKCPVLVLSKNLLELAPAKAEVWPQLYPTH